MNAGDLLRVAADKISIRARLAGLAVVAVPPDADDAILLEFLSRRVRTRLHDLSACVFERGTCGESRGGRFLG